MLARLWLALLVAGSGALRRVLRTLVAGLSVEWQRQLATSNQQRA
jgi:hypothetical protein